MRVVLDTNVLVSGLLNPDGNPGRVLDLFLAGEITLVVDDRILSEYRAVLGRRKFGFDPSDISAVMDQIEVESVRVTAPPLDVLLPDANDLPFLEVAVAGDAETLVTGNARHFKKPRGGLLAIEGPAEFIRRWRVRS